ncbi:hypothetical protein D3C75_747880 [compost metagenome]
MIRLIVSYLHVTGYLNINNFLIGLFFVEGLQGLLFLGCIKFLSPINSAATHANSVRQVISRNRKMIKASWLSNILNGFVKHSDVFLIGILAGPSSVLLYRPVKSIINLVFNVASSLSIVYVSDSGINKIKNLARSKIFLACLLLFILLISLLSLAANTYLNLFLPNAAFQDAPTVVFLCGLSCLLVFLNRFLHSVLTLLEANSVLIISSLVDASSLYLFFFLLVPATGVAGAVFAILASSLIFFTYSFFHINQRITMKQP